MDKLFLSVLNMSITGAFVIAAICLIRLPLKKAPKVISYCLWAVAGFRLVFPFSLSSIFSLIPFKASPIPPDIAMQAIPRIDSGIRVIDNTVSAVLPAATPYYSANPLQIWTFIGALLWLTGAAIMLIYGVVSYFLLKRKMRAAIFVEENIYEANNIRSPFLLGVFKPRIYIPTGLAEQEWNYVILHEKIHIRRHDYIIKFIVYFILCLHWFNLLAWVAFILMGADMELSCDERAIKELGGGVKRDYSLALLSLATERRSIGGSPLAFGEGGMKERVKNVLNFKKHSRIVIIAAVIAVAALSVGFAVNRGGINGTRPYKNMKADDVVSVVLTATPPFPEKTAEFSDAADIEKIVTALQAVVTYGEDPSKEVYMGQETTYTLTMKTGEKIEVVPFYPFLTIDGQRYKTEYESCYALSKLCNDMLNSNIAAAIANTASPSENGDGKTSVNSVEANWTADQSIGADMASLDYASGEYVIFHGYFGLFVYDLQAQKIIRSIDLSAIGCSATQGDNYCQVAVSADGGKVWLHPASQNIMYVYDLTAEPSIATLYETAYQWPASDTCFHTTNTETVVPNMNAGYSYSAVKFETGSVFYGYLYTSDWTLGTLDYIVGDKAYHLFKTGEPVSQAQTYTEDDYARQYVQSVINSFATMKYNPFKIVDSKITKFVKIGEVDDLKSYPLSVWQLDYQLKPENVAGVYIDAKIENGWITDYTGRSSQLVFSYETGQPQLLGAIEYTSDFRYDTTTQDGLKGIVAEYLQSAFGSYFGHVLNIDTQRSVIRLQKAQWLTAANDSEQLKTLGVDPQSLSNGFYVQEFPDAAPQEFGLTNATVFQVIDWNNYPQTKNLTMDEFAAWLSDHPNVLCHVELNNYFVASVKEQYLP